MMLIHHEHFDYIVKTNVRGDLSTYIDVCIRSIRENAFGLHELLSKHTYA